MSVCILVAGHKVVLAAATFTLAWTHSVEKTAWEEDWQLMPEGFVIAEARIKGSGAGMEPPADARLYGGWWHYVPQLPPLPEIVLARSGAAANWRLCYGGQCLSLEEGQGPLRIRPCVS